MKHQDMVALMGKVVTVHAMFLRRSLTGNTRSWNVINCRPWAGWIVGFSYKQDGQISYIGEEEGAVFHETSRQLCILVTRWPTKRPVPVPLSGYEMGGKPESPDYGGWRAYKAGEAVEAEQDGG